jgi:hypothetical protein
MRHFILLIFNTLIIVSCGGPNKKVSEDIPTFEDGKDFFVFDLEAGISEEPKFTTLNELIDSISYIPLETNNDALLPGRAYTFAKIGHDMFISGGASGNMSPIYRFDSSGKFVSRMTHIGRGPNEVVMPLWSYANINLRQINVIDVATAKTVIIQTESGGKSTIDVGFNRGIIAIPLNDSTFVSANMPDPENGVNTYLYFTDRNGNLIHSVERSDELLGYDYSLPENTISQVHERYWLATEYKGDAIFHNVFNDTLYRVKNYREVTPHLVFKRGALSPDPEDTFKPENKKRQVYFDYMMATRDHVILNYTFGNEKWRDIWSKHDSSLLLHYALKGPSYPFVVFAPFALPDGSVIELQIAYADEDKIYGVLEAMDACKFLPGVKEDDNPVIVVAKLRN